MAKIELSISAEYVPDWNIWSACRELIQNAADEADANPQHPMCISYSAKTKQMSITSENVKLDRSVLLLGESSKRGQNLRGSFGEGIDLALLVLARGQRKIRIENDDESWIPKLEHSEQWGKTVLVIYTNRFKHPKGHFQIEVDEFEPEEWKVVQERCLLLPTSLRSSEVVLRVGKDTVLLDRPGEVFVKGLWVATYTDLKAGYDLFNAKLDRDRRLVDVWDLRTLLSGIWIQALQDQHYRDVAQKKVQQMLDEDARDVEGLPDALHYGFGPGVKEAKEQIAASFTSKYGESAVPVCSTSEAEEVTAAGLTPVPVTSKWKETLERATGKTVEDKTKEALERVTKVLVPDDLSELGLLERWRAIRGLASQLKIEAPLSVVEFQDVRMLGQYRKQAGEIQGALYLALSVLQREAPGAAVVSLIHEAAHEVSTKHGHDHHQAVEILMETLINLWHGTSWSSLGNAARS